MKKSCKNCKILKELHKIGRDCDIRIDCNANFCTRWIEGNCRNDLERKNVNRNVPILRERIRKLITTKS